MRGLVDYDVSDDEDDESFGEGSVEDPIANGDKPSILNCLPSAADVHTEVIITNGDSAEEDRLEDLVKRKDWELKLARKLEKKKRKKSKKLKKVKSSSGGHLDAFDSSSKDSSNTAPKAKRAKILAFGGLKALNYHSEEDESDNDKLCATNSNVDSSGLLGLLPKPKSLSVKKCNSNLNQSKSNLFLPNSMRRENVIRTELAKSSTGGSATGQKWAKPLVKESDGDDNDADETCDYFGLNAAESIPEISVFPELVAILPSTSSGGINMNYAADQPTQPQATSGMSDTDAMELITREALNAGGRMDRIGANDIIDVNVDKALGPNVRANLLKNLHNKSLAEASIAHLSNLPKIGGSKNLVARRKHQITYLADVAVAREELLAEQWSQNRHAKRMSAQKYGF